jgi:cytoskeleton protein RodZ
LRSGQENALPSFGEKLKREREKRAVTLEQISVSTKIGTRMLQALEEDKFGQLPGGIFNKGFVRAYARCVGLDEDQAVADYLEASGEAVPARIDASAEPERGSPESNAERPSGDLPWGLFAAVLLLVALILSVWSYHKREHRAPPATSNSAPASSLTPSPASGASSKTTLAASYSSAVVPQAKSQGGGPELQARTLASEKTSSPNVALAAGPASPAQLGEFTVLIQAREDSWVSITADGKVLLSDTLIAGDQRSVHGRKQVVIRAGNTGAVDLAFNGKKLASQGDYGEVKTLTFGASGLELNRPSPPATQ